MSTGLISDPQRGDILQHEDGSVFIVEGKDNELWGQQYYVWLKGKTIRIGLSPVSVHSDPIKYKLGLDRDKFEIVGRCDLGPNS